MWADDENGFVRVSQSLIAYRAEHRSVLLFDLLPLKIGSIRYDIDDSMFFGAWNKEEGDDEDTAIRLKLTDAAHRMVQSLTVSVRIEIRPGKDSSLVLFQTSKECRGLIGRIGALLLWWKGSSWIGRRHSSRRLEEIRRWQSMMKLDRRRYWILTL